MSPSDARFIEDLPRGPLDEYRKQANFDWKKLKLIFEDPDLLKLKLKVWSTLEKDPLFQRPPPGLTTEDLKRRAAVQLHKFRQYRFLPENAHNLPYKVKTRYLMTVNEALAVCFPDVSIKQALGMGLTNNTIACLGTERHERIRQAVWNKKILSCLAITEVAHGSNTKQMRTTATYDINTQEFVINTPDFEAAKCWVGNLGKTCTFAILFAQLYTQGQCHGLHAFVVPIRDPKTLEPYPGIVVGDMGEKIGLHGIDNGFIMFNNYRIPRENLLNRTADVTPEGDYESSFSDPARILGAALESLSTGRIGIMQESSNNLISAVTIAVRYAAVRRQFGLNGDSQQEELPLIEYQLHRWRLFGHVSAAAVLKIFVRSLTDMYLSLKEESATTSSEKLENLSDMVSEIHAVICSAKALITWSCRDAAQECREACGGHGFLKAARLGDIRNVNDPCVTYEGDNNILVQQTSNWLLRQWQTLTEEGKFSSPLNSCAYLKHHHQSLLKKFSGSSKDDILNFNFITECFEWLIAYLLLETYNKQRQLTDSGQCKITARNNSQVFKAAVLSRVYAEFLAFSHFWQRTHTPDIDDSSKVVLEKLGYLYALTCLDKHLVYFYQGGFALSPAFASLIKDNIIYMGDVLKPDIIGVVDALAPPDYALNSVLGRADGKLYTNLQSEFFHNSSGMSRPNWWHEILVQDVPDVTPYKSKL